MNDGGCHPRITYDQGTWIYRGWMKNWYLVLHEKTLCNRREFFSLNKHTREKGIQPSEILPLRPSSLLLKLERGGCDLMAHWALLRRYDRGVSTLQLCTLLCAYGMWTPLPDAPHISERK